MPEDVDLRIAVENLGGTGWTGGSVYLTNLLLAIVVAGKPRVHAAVLDGSDSPVPSAVRDAADDVIPLPAPRRNTIVSRIHRRLRRSLWLRQRVPLAPLLQAHGIDVLFTLSGVGRGVGVPWIGWIPDFQHVHLRSMFGDDEIRYRNDLFSDIAKHARAVVLSSHTALADYKAFAPESAAEPHVVRFVAPVPAVAFDAPIPPVLAKYHLPDRFFYLPNQLWRHKNIEVVIDALALLDRRGRPVTVVSTGNMTDYRHPGYVSEVLRRIAEAGIHDQLRLLGMVDRSEVFTLARQSVAVLQPSLFEGWSTSVEECKSIGKRMVLSDLPVHREQDPPLSAYFSPQSAEALAEALTGMWDAVRPGPDEALEAAARGALAERFRTFGSDFIAVARRAASRR